ncbi:MAG TPA: glycosyltransferase [Chitinophagaceae bacterium]|nr:glycosyltransferase [Chitinophagaceae bacterium]
MPRVLRILNRLAIGGPLLNASYLTKYMAPEFETMLVVGEREDHEKDASFVTDGLGIQPVFIPEMGRSVDPRKDYMAYKKMKKLIADFKPDIVHSHSAKPGAIGRMAAKAMNVPVIVHTYHGHVFHSYFHPLKTKLFINIERKLGKKTDAIVAISQQQKKELTIDFNIAPENKFRVIPLGLDLDKFQINREEKRQAFRSSFGIKEDEVVLTITGRLVPIKNQVLFLEGIKHLLQNSRQAIKAFIVGDGESRTLLEEKARQLNIGFSTEKHIKHDQPLVFTSWRSDIDHINAGSDIIVLTSFNEGTPVSLIEAQAACKPVVSTRVGGIEDVVKDNETGLLSDINDTASFCKNLIKMTESKELRCKFGEAGEEYVSTRYSYRRLVNDMSVLYHDLLSAKTNV